MHIWGRKQTAEKNMKKNKSIRTRAVHSRRIEIGFLENYRELRIRNMERTKPDLVPNAAHINIGGARSTQQGRRHATGATFHNKGRCR